MTAPAALLKAWKLEPKKQLGQNFLKDPSTTEMIVSRAALSPDDVILEIGAGLGALTVPLARKCRKVYALETDGRLMDLLHTELLAQQIGNVEILKEDILKFDIAGFARKWGKERKLVVFSNLPYNISSQVTVRLIHARSGVDRAVMMFQKEMADRLKAVPGTKDYSRLTVMLRYCADVRSLAAVGANMFYPRPKIDSEVVEIRFKDPLPFPAEDEALLFKIVKAAFGQRRKTLRNALAGSAMRIPPDMAKRFLEAAGIDPTRRAETLEVSEFVALSREIAGSGYE